MIASYHTLDLHCEHGSHRIEQCDGEYLDLSHPDGCGGRATEGGAIGIGRFIAADGMWARGAARAKGWRFDLETGEAWCPVHSRLSPLGKKQNQDGSP